MTSGGRDDPPVGSEPILEAMGLHTAGLPGLDDIPAATHWPTILSGKTASEWEELRGWVERLTQRFAHLDHHVIPSCWWRHNSHVEALAALRDHERVSYLASAPATAPVEWMRALRDITALLRSWTAENPCGASHQEPPVRLRQTQYQGWDEHVAADIESRRRPSRGRQT